MKVPKIWILVLPLILFFGYLLPAGCRRAPTGRPVGEIYERLDRPEVFLVPPTSRAQTAGIISGDIILEYNGSPVQTYHELQALETVSAGTSVQVVVLRNDHEQILVAEPGPLGFVPNHFRYCGSLALALEAILASFGRTMPYSWLAALTGESFSISGRTGDWGSWWPGGGNTNYLEEIAEVVGIRAFRMFVNNGSDSLQRLQLTVDSALPLIRQGLRSDGAVLARARWGKNPGTSWGVLATVDDSNPAIQAYSIGSASPQPLTGEILEIYTVQPKTVSEPEPAVVLATALEHALELSLSLAEVDTGWRSGLDAYDALIAGLDTAPAPEVLSTRQEQFHRLVWALIGCKQTASVFLEEMREALVDETELLDEAISAHRTILSKLEGLLQAGISLASSADRQRIQVALNEIQLVENDLLGFYEEIIGEL